MIRSRVTFAMTLAAAMEKLILSPWMRAVCGIGRFLMGKPSTRA